MDRTPTQEIKNARFQNFAKEMRAKYNFSSELAKKDREEASLTISCSLSLNSVRRSDRGDRGERADRGGDNRGGDNKDNKVRGSRPGSESTQARGSRPLKLKLVEGGHGMPESSGIPKELEGKELEGNPIPQLLVLSNW